MHETLPIEQQEAIKHNFLRALERELAGVEHQVVIENGVALVLAWGEIFKKGVTETITSKLRSLAKDQGLVSEIFVAGSQVFPTVKIALLVPPKVYGLFNLFDDNKPVEKMKNWDVVFSENQDVASVCLKFVSTGTDLKKFLTDYAQMVAYVKNQMGNEVDFNFGLSGVNANLLKILLMKNSTAE